MILSFLLSCIVTVFVYLRYLAFHLFYVHCSHTSLIEHVQSVLVFQSSAPCSKVMFEALCSLLYSSSLVSHPYITAIYQSGCCWKVKWASLHCLYRMCCMAEMNSVTRLCYKRLMDHCVPSVPIEAVTSGPISSLGSLKRGSGGMWMSHSADHEDN